MSPLLFVFGVGGVVLVGATMEVSSSSIPTRWSGSRSGSTTSPPCSVRYPLAGSIDPALWTWRAPNGYRFAWLRSSAYVEAWSHQMGHDLGSFMEARPTTDFAFGIVDGAGMPKASFVLEWLPVGTWAIRFAQGAGSAPIDAETFTALRAYGAWLGLGCVPSLR